MRVRQVLTILGLLLTSCRGEPSSAAKLRDAGVQPIVANPADSRCKVDSDCAWSDIDHEIHKLTDCVCVFSCRLLPLSLETAQRRFAQREGVCEPALVGTKAHCEDMDCDTPLPIACVEGACRAVAEADDPEDPAGK